MFFFNFATKVVDYSLTQAIRMTGLESDTIGTGTCFIHFLHLPNNRKNRADYKLKRLR
jgi:hypothetical protein